jgi:hypothetical protein
LQYAHRLIFKREIINRVIVTARPVNATTANLRLPYGLPMVQGIGWFSLALRGGWPACPGIRGL